MTFKKHGFSVLILITLLICYQNIIYSQSVSLDSEKEKQLKHGISIAVNPNMQIHSVFNNSEVVQISNDENDQRNFGKYVEVKSNVTYKYKGSDITDTICLIYSNLSTINVEIGQITKPETIIGLSGGKGTNIFHNASDLYIYLYTTKQSPYLNLKTKNHYIEENGVYWWDPSFLFAK